MKQALAVAITALSLKHAVTSPILEARQGGSGAGPYAPGAYKTDSGLKDHTIYYPTKTTGTEKMPVLVWGNGGCSNQGLSNQALLQNIASYGFLAIAEGAPTGGGSSSAQTMKQAIDWIFSAAGTDDYANVDNTKIMAAGFSCGGVEAMDNIWDERVDSVGVISSGLLTNQTAAAAWTKPVLFVLGGSGDIAYANGERDYNNMKAGVPTWKGNINVGHGGTLNDQDGGRFGKVILNWMLYHMKGQETGLQYLQSGYSADGWQVQQKSMENFKPL